MPFEHNKYSNMQRNIYDKYGMLWSLDNKNEIVGPFDAHNDWKDYDIMFDNISDLKDKICLDFGCGPGRNLIKYTPIFKRIDGADISTILLDKAKAWILHNNCDINKYNLYHVSGFDLKCIDSEIYDIVMSTICLQHICVRDIRNNLFKEFYRIIKKDGFFTAQMGFGVPSPYTVDYNANHYDATETNRACDVAIDNPDQLKNDLYDAGFKNFEYKITEVGPGDIHPNWIFFRGQK